MRRGHCVGLCLTRVALAIAIDDDAVHVVASDEGGPLVADKSREPAGLAISLGGVDDRVPGALVGFRARVEALLSLQPRKSAQRAVFPSLMLCNNPFPGQSGSMPLRLREISLLCSPLYENAGCCACCATKPVL